MFRPGGQSKASASTLCQKCLKRDNYECKAVAQERPYVSRPSRSQMLANPKLLPKLTSDVPQDLLRKKGIADEQLAKLELDRGRKRDRASPSPEPTGQLKRQRSLSSSASVSSLSTRSGGSKSPERISRKSQTTTNDRVKNGRRDDRFSSSSRSVSRNRAARSDGRSTRRRISQTSPLPRGRQQYRSSSRSASRSRNRSSVQPPKGNNDQKSVRHQNGGRDESSEEVEHKASANTREKSLSPFSKRLALTNSVGGGGR